MAEINVTGFFGSRFDLWFGSFRLFNTNKQATVMNCNPQQLCGHFKILSNLYPNIILFLENSSGLIDSSRFPSLMSLQGVGWWPIRCCGYFRSYMPYLEELCQ